MTDKDGGFKWESREPLTPVQSKALCDVLDRQIELAKLQNDADIAKLRYALTESADWLEFRVINIIPADDKPATQARINMARAALQQAEDSTS